MALNRILAVAGAALLLGTGAALADGHKAKAKGGVLVHPYHAENLCPAGLQPVTVMGVICCGTPNTHAAYVDRPGGKRKAVRHTHRAASRYYTVEGEKGVRMR